jgi:hypothetical protein
MLRTMPRITEDFTLLCVLTFSSRVKLTQTRAVSSVISMRARYAGGASLAATHFLNSPELMAQDCLLDAPPGSRRRRAQLLTGNSLRSS